jgi:hypothetical protein
MSFITTTESIKLMKNFTLLMALCAMFTTGLFAQPTTSAPTPTKLAANVKSIFSGAYTDVTGTNFNPFWGQGTVVTDYTIAGTTDVTKKYAALDYQGTEFTTINASAMTALHVDVWSDVVTVIDLFPINSGQPEKFAQRTTVVGWNSFEFLTTEFTSQGLPMTNVIQFKIIEDNFVYHGGTKTIYLDNIYFWKPSNVPAITGFTIPEKLVGDAAFTLTAPTSNSTGAFTYMSSDPTVATVSGNTVTIVGAGTTTITANQEAASPFIAGSAVATLVVSYPPPTTIPAAPTKAASDVISVLSAAYTNIVVTNWRPDWGQGTTFVEFPISGDPVKKYAALDYEGIDFEAHPIDATNMTTLHWDIYTDVVTNIKISIIAGGGGGERAVAKTTVAGWNSFDIPMTDYTSQGGFLVNNLIQFKFEENPNIYHGGTKTVYLDNIYFWKSAVAPITTPTVAAASPTLPANQVLSLYSGMYTDVVATTWNQYNGGTLYAEQMVATNPTQKYSNLSYTVNNLATPINLGRTTPMFIHLDVWSANAIAANNFKVKLVDFGPNHIYGFSPTAGDDSEGEVGAIAIPAATWTALDIPITDFAAQGLTATQNIAQLILSMSPTGGTVFVDNIYFFANAVLAVNLTTFTAKAVNTTSVLNWSTASEKDNAGFTIERSANGTNFVAIGEVKGNGTTTSVSNYTFTDVAPLTGLNYYRLRQADVSGKETMSKVATVLFGKTTGLFIKNTLVHDALEVTVGESEKGPLSIFNVAGQLVYSVKVQGTQRLDLSNLSAGMYVIRLATGEAKRFVKD